MTLMALFSKKSQTWHIKVHLPIGYALYVGYGKTFGSCLHLNMIILVSAFDNTPYVSA